MNEYDILYKEWLEKSMELYRLERRMENLALQQKTRKRYDEMSDEEREAMRKHRRMIHEKKRQLCANA